MPEEASDSLDVPPSPAPSEYGSYASSISRFRYSKDIRSLWAPHNDLLIVQAFCICFHCSSLLSYNPPTLPLCWAIGNVVFRMSPNYQLGLHQNA